MPKPAHRHFVISGTLPGGEIFATGFDAINAAANQAALDADCAAVAASMTTAGATNTLLKSLLPSGSAFTRVTGYSYAAAAPTASLVSLLPITVAGSGGGAMPFQVCIVATLLTAVPSRRTRGRMYWPATAAVVSSTTGLVTTPTAANVAAATKEIIGSVFGAGVASVISAVGNSSQPITAVRVDNRADIQRRRANKQLPTVTSTVVV